MMLIYRRKIQKDCLALCESNSETDFFLKQFVLYNALYIPRNFIQYTLCLSSEEYMWQITGVILQWEIELDIV